MSDYTNDVHNSVMFGAVADPASAAKAITSGIVASLKPLKTVNPFSSVKTASIPSMTPGVSLLPPGAGFGASQASLATYQYLNRKKFKDVLGEFRSQMNGNIDFYPADAFKALATDERFRRKTNLDQSWCGIEGSATWATGWIKYLGTYNGFDYHNAKDYNYTLSTEYDPLAFVKLLKMYRCAGIELNPQYDVTTPGTGIFGEPKKRHNTNAPPVTTPGIRTTIIEHEPILLNKELQHTLNHTTDWLKESYFTMGVNVAALKASAHWGYPRGGNDWVTINRYKYVRYGTAADQAAQVDFVANILRFRERVLAWVLKECNFMLDTAQLEDQDTLKTLANYIAQRGYAPYNEIMKSELYDLYEADGKTPIKLHVPTNLKDMIEFTDTSGNKRRMTIENCLKLQFESCIWILLVNQDKYYGRIAQLQDYSAVLSSNKIMVPFSMDPWKNPFLVFDLAASKAAGKPVYKDVAAHFAQKPEADRIVVDETVPLKHMLLAPTVKASLIRSVPGAGGGLYVPEGAAKKDSGIWALTALAAAAGLYFMNK